MAKTQHDGSMAWIDNRYKLVLPKGKNAKYERYDLEIDREEKNNIASQQPELVETMKAQLLKWQASVERSLTGADY